MSLLDPPAPGGLESVLGYSFSDRDHLLQALRHRSWVAETGQGPSNERLEFLGDTILQLVVTDFIFVNYPDYPEGDLVKLRSSVVRNDVLFAVAEALGLDGYLMLGKGEEATGGRNRPSILADAMEAVLGAIYLDGGLAAARRVIMQRWEGRIRTSAVQPGWGDHKSRLQEILARSGKRPVYRLTSDGPDHQKVFTAVVVLDGTEYRAGKGRSKREAEQEAARAALETLAAGRD